MLEHPVRYMVLTLILVVVTGLSAAVALSVLETTFVVLGTGAVMLTLAKVLPTLFRRMRASIRLSRAERTSDGVLSQ